MTKERNDLSVDAVKINGAYLEDQVPGYQTIKSVGREIVLRELESTSTRYDGSVLKNVKYTSREIEVSFIVQRGSMADMRAAMENLKAALDVKEAQIIFNDDAAFFFTGTPALSESITEVWNGLVGTFTIHCMDPCKYSITEYSATPTNNTWTINYDGTYKSHPKFEVVFPTTLNSDGDNTDTSECGYVGFANQAGAVLQFGDPEETDWADVTYPAEVVLNRTFTTKTGWTQNGSAVLSGTQVGTVTANSNGYIYPSAWGSGTGWHGPSLSKIITGETDPISKNFNFTWKQKFVGNKKQFGRCAVILWNNNGGTRTLVGAVQIVKTSKDAKCEVYLYVGSTSYKQKYTVACSKVGSCSMKKLNEKITFSVAGSTKTISSSNITDLIANEVTFHFGRNNTQTVLANNYIYNCKLQRFSFDNYEDIENVFSPGDRLIVDTKEAAVKMDNGDGEINAQSIGALGNDWETFVLTPGTNTIEVEFSDWTTTTPNVTLKYRKVYL